MSEYLYRMGNEEVKNSSKLNSVDNYSFHSNYHFTLSSNIDIFSELKIPESVQDNPQIQSLLNKVLFALKREIEKHDKVIHINNVLSKLIINEEADGAVLLEWGFSNFRICFAFEKNIEDSSYNIVSDDRITGEYFSRSSKLTDDNYAAIIQQIFNLVLENT